MMTATLWPAWRRSIGRAPQTSASPPVLANGATSLVAKTMFKVRPPHAHIFVARFDSLRGYSVSVGAGPAKLRSVVRRDSWKLGNWLGLPLKSIQQAQHGSYFHAATTVYDSAVDAAYHARRFVGWAFHIGLEVASGVGFGRRHSFRRASC